MSSQLGGVPNNHQNTGDDEYHYGNWNVTPEMLYETNTDDEYLEYKYSDSERKEPSFGKNGLAMLERPPLGDLVCEKINHFLHCSHHEQVYKCCFSRDGSKLVCVALHTPGSSVSDWQGFVKVWDTKTGNLLVKFRHWDISPVSGSVIFFNTLHFTR